MLLKYQCNLPRHYKWKSMKHYITRWKDISMHFPLCVCNTRWHIRFKYWLIWYINSPVSIGWRRKPLGVCCRWRKNPSVPAIEPSLLCPWISLGYPRYMNHPIIISPKNMTYVMSHFMWFLLSYVWNTTYKTLAY